MPLLDGFATRRITTSGAEIHLRMAGDGPPLLLLHGYPQTHVMWHLVAPALAETFTVACPDLRGYGDSSKPPSGPDCMNYSKREMARDMVEVMETLGHTRFQIGAHDRGARIAHRLAADWPDRIRRLAVLDIAPTREMYRNTAEAFARAYWHWFFLIRPHPMPETLINADPEAYLREKATTGASGSDVWAPEAFTEYLRCLTNPETVRAQCDDYRAAAGIDLAHDDADGDRKIDCPLLCLWGASGAVERCFDPLALWRERARDVRGHTLPCGHYLAEECPEKVISAFQAFFVIG